LAEFNRNLVDPIKLTFDSIVYSQSIEETIENEVLRQLDKSNSNLIGYFHQNIFHHLNPKWNVPKHGYDVENMIDKVFVEMKNKHNTMNSSSSAKTFMRMQSTIIRDPLSTCLLVEVIAKRSQNVDWVVTLDGTRMIADNRIRRVSIDKFYDMVTGEKNSFARLCKVLPRVIEDVVKENSVNSKSNTVFQELEAISPNLLTSIYLLSFKNYDGFVSFKL
jgi:hypothetical protein